MKNCTIMKKNIKSSKQLLFEMVEKIDPNFKKSKMMNIDVSEDDTAGLDKYKERAELSDKEMVEMIKNKLDKIVSDPDNLDNDAIPVLFDMIVGKKIRFGGKMLEEINNLMEVLNEATSDEIYFNTQTEAFEYAVEKARQRGFEVKEEDLQNSAFIQGWVGTENTRRDSIPLYKDGKLQRKMLQIILYRMPTGNYELTSYIN